MRIGIYTQPLRYNYGGLLQNYALQTTLQRMGHEAYTIDPSPYRHLSWTRAPFAYAKRAAKKLMGRQSRIFSERHLNREYDIKIQHLRPFIEQYIKRREVRHVGEVGKDEFDALIAGSDQVWRPMYNVSYGRTIENAFFDFASDWDIPRIAYAASFGTDEWEFTPEQTERCSRLSKLFKAVSVREASGVELCWQHLGIEAVHVLDPTLLLQREDYERIIENGIHTTKPSGSLLCYILDDAPEKNELICRIGKEKGLVPFMAHSRVFDKEARIEDKIQPPVEQWLRNFKEAEFVVTDSFHACVFSIIFGKPFVVVGNAERGMARYHSLLDMFSLQDHLIASYEEYNPDRDYSIPDDAYQKLASLQELSVAFLHQALS